MSALNVCTMQLYLTTDKQLELYIYRVNTPILSHLSQQERFSTAYVSLAMFLLALYFVFFFIRFVSLRSFKFVNV